MVTRRVGWGLAAALALTGGGVRAAPPLQTFDLTLRPVRAGDGQVSAIAVKEVLSRPLKANAPLSFEAAVTYANVTHVADRITELQVRDAAGPLPLDVKDDPEAPGGFPYFRHWRPTRPVTYPVQVTYTALVQPPGGPNGPAFGIRPSGGGVSGAGNGFLMLPEGDDPVRIDLRWDLAGLADGSIGSTTLGDGSFSHVGPVSDLGEIWMMAGPAQHFEPSGGLRFQAFWLGHTPYDARAEMAWAAQAYSYMARFYAYLDPPPEYRVYLRALDTPPYGGGTALGPSFMFSGPTTTPPKHLRITLFHEMSHQWVGHIDGPEDQIAWYAEGLNVFYTTLLPLRSGLLPVSDYLEQVNSEAENYYTSPARNKSAAEIGQIGFGDEKIRATPYNRGALYWADLDYQIRQKTHGRRTLDDMFRPLWVKRKAGAPFNQAVVEDAIARELGPDAVVTFREEMITGQKTVVPASGAFGPCFERHPASFDTPHGKVDGWLWARVPGMSDEACRQW